MRNNQMRKPRAVEIIQEDHRRSTFFLGPRLVGGTRWCRSSDDVTFPSALVCQERIDALTRALFIDLHCYRYRWSVQQRSPQDSRTKEKANLYVTALAKEFFSVQELTALNPGDTQNDSRYQMIRDNCLRAVMRTDLNFSLFQKP
jgi:hypothetical protein